MEVAMEKKREVSVIGFKRCLLIGRVESEMI